MNFSSPTYVLYRNKLYSEYSLSPTALWRVA
jgi:hypothetical protein